MPDKSGMSRFHPTRRFTLAGLNAAFPTGTGRPRGHYRTAEVDPHRSFGAAPAGYRVGQEAAIRNTSVELLI
jgi:hypothetical protein